MLTADGRRVSFAQAAEILPARRGAGRADRRRGRDAHGPLRAVAIRGPRFRRSSSSSSPARRRGPRAAGGCDGRRRRSRAAARAGRMRRFARSACPPPRSARCGTWRRRYSAARSCSRRAASRGVRRGDRGATHRLRPIWPRPAHGSRHRPVVGGDAPDLPAAAPRRVAARRPRGSPGYGLAWKVPTPTARAPADRRQSRPVSEKPIVRNVESDASSSWILSCGPINRLPGDRWRHVAQTRECAKLYPVGALVHLAQPIGSGLAASRPWVLADDNAGARQRLDRLDQLVVVHPRRTAGHDGRTHPCQRRSNGAGAHERSRQSRRLDPAGRSYPKNARLQSSARSSTSKSRYRSFWSSSLATLRGVLAPDTDARARGRAPRR